VAHPEDLIHHEAVLVEVRGEGDEVVEEEEVEIYIYLHSDISFP
jgi:hypothetical protein